MYCLRLKKKVSGGEALKEHEFLGGEEQGFCLVIIIFFIFWHTMGIYAPVSMITRLFLLLF